MTESGTEAIASKINIGCGYDKRAGYLNVDVDPACEPDLLLKDHDLSALPSNSFDEVLAWDVLEHIPHAYTMSALLDWAGLLKEGGSLVLQTSYIFGVIDTMRMAPSFETEFNWTRCLFGNQGHSGDFHHVGFTDRTLRTALYVAGFRVPAFKIIDGWLIHCVATKRDNWLDLLDLPPMEAIGVAFDQYLRRPIDQGADIVYASEFAGGAKLRDLVKRIIGSPEAMYKAGAMLDADPFLAAA